MPRKKAAETPAPETEATQETLAMVTVEDSTTETAMAPQSESASVIVPSDTPEATYEPLKIVSNIAGVRAWVAKQVEPFKGAVIDVSDKAKVSEARKVLADLNKIGKAINAKRIAEVKAMTAPITAFDNDFKAVKKEIDDAYAGCKKQLDDAAEAYRDKRTAELHEEYAGIVGDEIASLIPADRLIDASWLNPSTSKKKGNDGIFEAAQSVVRDVQALADAKLDHREQVLAFFYDSLSLRESLAEDARITMREAEKAEKAAKVSEAFHVPARHTMPATPKFEEVEPDPIAVDPVLPVYDWALQIDFVGTKELAKKLGSALRELGISGGKIECKGAHNE